MQRELNRRAAMQVDRLGLGDGPAIQLDGELRRGVSRGSLTFGTGGPLGQLEDFQVQVRGSMHASG